MPVKVITIILTFPELTMTLVGGNAPFTYSWAYKAPTSTSFQAIAAGGTSIGKSKRSDLVVTGSEFKFQVLR